MMNATHHVRSKSPFRRSRSKSPFRNLTGRAMSPFSRHRRSQSGNPEDALHESEINIFQQLCLDRQDETAAIEILLEDSADNKLFKKTEVPDLYTASSASSDPSSRTPQSRGTNATRGSNERKKPFFKRLFKSPRKQSPDNELTKFPSTPCHSLPESQSSGPSEDMNYLPKPPSGVPKVRTLDPLVAPAPTPISRRVQSEQLDDTFSNMSSISGSHMPGIIPPVHLDRQESLGMDSIKDIRKALKEMEKQLGRATNKGERISRQKVMRALFTVADSLDDMEERDFLRNELEGMMRIERASANADAHPLSVASSDDDKSDMTTTDDEEDYTESQAPSSHLNSEANDKENVPSSLFSSVGRLFGMSNDAKVEVEKALDDLLWTEFVATRKAKENKAQRVRTATAKPARYSQQKLKPQRSRVPRDIGGNQKMIMERKRETPFRDASPFNEGRRIPLEPRHVASSQPVQRARSWWRKHPSGERYSPGLEYGNEDEYDDGESYSSDEVPDYLPTSITVRKRNGRRSSARQHATPFGSNPRYKVKLVDTESRHGYEMGSTTSSMRYT